MRAIYDESVYPKTLEGLPHVDSPTFVIICAQPGAGKSGLSSRIRAAFKSVAADPAHIDVDDLRQYHARLPEIIAEDPIRMGEHTNEAVNIWKGFLLDKSRADSNNVVLEITLRTADAAKSEIDKFQKRGYAVELHAMAVHQNISRLGVFQRFEGAIKTDKDAARYVPLAFHDAAYHALPRNVDDVERNFALNLVTVNTRGGDIVYKRVEQEGEPEAMKSILLERNRSWMAGDRAAHIIAWAEIVKDVMKRTNDKLKDDNYIQDLYDAVFTAVGHPVIQIPARATEQDIENVIKRAVNGRILGP